MKSSSSSFRFKAVLVLGILGAASFLGWRQAQQIRQTQTALETLRQEQGGLSRRLTEVVVRLEEARTESRQGQTLRQSVQRETVRLEAELDRVDPEARWATPPDHLPEWGADSPYVWLRKDRLPDLPVGIFYKDGRLDPEMAGLVHLDSAQQQVLAEALPRLVTEYRELEISQAEETKGHPFDNWENGGDAITVETKTSLEDGQRLRQSFESILRETAGEKRAALLLATGARWLDETFITSTNQAKRYSLRRQVNGNYDVVVRNGSSWMSTMANKGNETSLGYYLPKRLLPHFSSLIPPDVMEKILTNRYALP